MNATIRIKGYERVEQIAQGRHAAVFKAYDCARQRAVVFKVLLPHLVEDPRFLTRFKRVVQIAARIHHENLVNVLLCGRADLSYFIAYEHYHGVSLEKILSDRPRIPVEIALQIVLGVANGLEACHRKQVIHRDVRPGNIILTKGGGIKLDNLSLATDVSETGRVGFAGHVSSAVAHMSPEQTLGENLAVQSDVFSLGVVAWELLCGERAFGQGNSPKVLESIRTASLKRVSDLNPLVEAALSDIVQRMVEKDRSRRYADATEVAAGLREAMRNLGYGTDAKVAARFVEDPAAYTESHTKDTIRSLKEKVGAAGEANPAALVGYYEKLAYLEPNDEGHRREIERLTAMAKSAEKTGSSPALSGEDPRVLYRVVLESLDTQRESKASFALKLATKLRVPITAVKPLVEHMPAALPGGHMHRKALFVAKIMEELGAVTRIEACRSEAQRRLCPACGSAVEPDAEYCANCQQRFAAVVELHPGLDDAEDEPSAAGRGPGHGPGIVRRLFGTFSKSKR